MGRLDSAESRETSRRKIEGKNEFSSGGVEKSNDRLSMKGGENRFVDVPRKYLIAAPRLELELSRFMRAGIEIDDRLFRKRTRFD